MAEDAGVGLKDNGGRSGAGFEAGTGRPPRHARFRPGRSGNPSGRPRKPRSLARELLEVLDEPVTLGEGEARETVGRRRAIPPALAAKAAAGDPKALAQAIQWTRRTAGFRPGLGAIRTEDEAVGCTNSLPTREEQGKTGTRIRVAAVLLHVSRTQSHVSRTQLHDSCTNSHGPAAKQGNAGARPSRPSAAARLHTRPWFARAVLLHHAHALVR